MSWLRAPGIMMLSFGLAVVSAAPTARAASQEVTAPEAASPAPEIEPFEPEPETETETEPEPGGEPSEESSDSPGALRWGYQRPIPRWKWAGLGASVGVLVVAAGGAIITAAWLNGPHTRSFSFRRRLLDAAEASLAEPDPFNQVSPLMAGDLCEYNTTDDSGQPLVGPDGGQATRNVGVAEVCQRGIDVRKAQVALGITAVAGLVSTAVFTTLLFVHREPARRVTRVWRQRGLHLGVGAGRGRGPVLRLGGRV